jgi:hypothetical protein
MTLALLDGCSLPFTTSTPISKVHQVAYFSGGGPNPSNFVDVFRQALLDLGYADGRDVVVDERYANGDEQAATLLPRSSVSSPTS